MVREYIEKLIHYGRENELIHELDIVQTRNALLDLLEIEEPFHGQVSNTDESIDDILDQLLDYCYEKGIIKSNTITERDLCDTRIMGILTPKESEVVKNFTNIKDKEGVEKATDYFYELCKKTNYIRTKRIKKNLSWKAKTDYGEMDITINLSKPEKDPKEIEKAKHEKKKRYPKCPICVENVGFAGSFNHPARQNLRVIPLKLNEEDWYMQYSPYLYYNEHCIVLKAEHEPMKIDEKTFERLLDFVHKFPHYFLGSNADLPIVGGSILGHEHYQGGRHLFPLQKSNVEKRFSHPDFSNVNIGIVKWPMSVIRLTSKEKDALIELCRHILESWKDYSDEDVDILCSTEKDGEVIRHNTITPIARINEDKEYEIDLVLRNNRRSEEHPSGIFHPREDLHHIKKENIGLIEVMGLAILPGRLVKELNIIENILTGDEVDYYDENSSIYKHRFWIDDMKKRCGKNLDEVTAKEYIKREIGLKFEEILDCAGVFKRDQKGQRAFEKFMKELGLERI